MSSLTEKVAVLERAAKEGDNEEKRQERLNEFNALSQEIGQWLRVLQQRQRGPSLEELAAILRELQGGHVRRLRELAGMDTKDLSA